MSGGAPFSLASKSPASTSPAVTRPKDLRKKDTRGDHMMNSQQRQQPSQRQQQHYAPPQRYNDYSRGHNRGGGGGGGGGGGYGGYSAASSRTTPANFGKGRFVQSSFRILVDRVTPDVGEAIYSADALLDWSSICRVDLQCNDLLKCPICLEESMTIPKISRCGHVFCVACVFRYFLALQEYNGRFLQKCPVCNNQQWSPQELVSVRFDPVRPPREGDKLRFVLARRAASSTVVRPPPSASSPSGPAAGDEATNHPSSSSTSRRPRRSDIDALVVLPVEGEEGWHMSRLVKMKPGDYDKMLSEEIDTLQAYRIACLDSGDTELFPSIDAASKSLAQLRKERATSLAQQGDKGQLLDEFMLPEGLLETAEAVPSDSPAPRTSEGKGKERRSSAADSPGLASKNSPALSASDTPGQTAKGNPAHLISFYQTDDGRLIFLQPLFTRFLLHEFGGEWSGLPHYLPEVRTERVQEVTIAEETRRRHRFLSHLPIGTTVYFAEVDLRSVLSRETREHFADDFQKIRDQRKRDQAKSRREENVSKQRAAKEEEQWYAAANRPHPSTVVIQQVPTAEDFVPLPGRQREEGTEAAAAEESEGDTGPTLAQKLKSRMAAKAKPGSTKSNNFPALGLGNESSFPALGGGGGGGGGGRAGTGSSAARGTAGSATGAAGVAAASGAARGSRIGPSAAAGSFPASSGGSGGPGKSAAGSSGGGADTSAWGKKLPQAPKKSQQQPQQEEQRVKDCWDDDSEDDKPNFGSALDAVLARQRASSDEHAAEATADGEAAEGEQGAAAPAPGKKGKKGKAGKPQTIRLFG